MLTCSQWMSHAGHVGPHPSVPANVDRLLGSTVLLPERGGSGLGVGCQPERLQQFVNITWLIRLWRTVKDTACPITTPLVSSVCCWCQMSQCDQTCSTLLHLSKPNWIWRLSTGVKGRLLNSSWTYLGYSWCRGNISSGHWVGSYKCHPHTGHSVCLRLMCSLF